jgi:NAD(P)-dependent dehydrogenase (short-subunit alcohol dehydrogenase family)
MILVTGGAGFIGANFVLDWLAASDEPVINLDKLTYAGNLENLRSLNGDARHVFVQGDIGDRSLVEGLLTRYRPRAVINFAAESHVDRSIHGPGRLHPDQHRRHLPSARIEVRALLERSGMMPTRPRSASCTSRLMKFMARSARTDRSRSPRTPRSPRTARIPPARPVRIIWCAPITILTACRC